MEVNFGSTPSSPSEAAGVGWAVGTVGAARTAVGDGPGNATVGGTGVGVLGSFVAASGVTATVGTGVAVATGSPVSRSDAGVGTTGARSALPSSGGASPWHPRNTTASRSRTAIAALLATKE